MKLLLAIETSTAQYGLALGENDVVRAQTLAGPDTSRDLAASLRAILASAGAGIEDIGAIGVDIGPGSLGSLRDGVNFANALAYARGVPAYAFTSFELLGHAVASERRLLCVRRANEGLAYAGLFEGGAVQKMRWGALADIVRDLAGDAPVECAGALADAAAEVLGARARVVSTDGPRAATLIEIGVSQRSAHDPLRAPALPINERSQVFRD